MPCLLSSNSSYTPPDDYPEMQRYPYAAALKTIKTLNPDFHLDDIDILVYRRTLSGLFHSFDGFVSRSAIASILRLQLVGNTLIMSCGEGQDHIDRWRRPQSQEAFLRAVTTGSLKDELRVVKYDLGGLTCIVVSEADIFYTPPGPTATKTTRKGKTVSKGNRKGKTASKGNRKGKTIPKPDKETKTPATDCTAMICLGPPSLSLPLDCPGQYNDILPCAFFGRDDYIIRPIIAPSPGGDDETWLRDINVIPLAGLVKD
jgi:hypothetical protein